MRVIGRLFGAVAFVVLAALTAKTAYDWRVRKTTISDPSPGKVAAGKPKHAVMGGPVIESELNRVTLSEQAEARLGIEVQSVAQKSMCRSRPYGAEFVLPTGAAVVVSAPLSGTLQAPPRSHFPRVGEAMVEGSAAVLLLPMLTPERAVLTPAERVRFAEAKATVAQTKIDADGQYQVATTQVEAARISLTRAKRLMADNVGTRRAVDDAEAQLALAERTLAAAAERKKLVDGITLDQEAGTLQPLTVPSPLTGLVRTTHVQPGQMVAAGAPLFEVMNDSVLWLKVPVYVGELHELDTSRPARLTSLSGRLSETDRQAQPVVVPPTSLPLSSSVDLYYEIANSDHSYRPGQRIAAHIPLTGPSEWRAVPWSAVYHDVYGGEWVYERVAAHTYSRRRIEVGWIDEGWVAVLRGPEVGTVVVTAGVAELAGTEFGFAK